MNFLERNGPLLVVNGGKDDKCETAGQVCLFRGGKDGNAACGQLTDDARARPFATKASHTRSHQERHILAAAIAFCDFWNLVLCNQYR